MSDLAARAAALGIETEYTDARGVRRTVATQTLERLIGALSGPEGRIKSAPPAVVVRQGRGAAASLRGILPLPGWRVVARGREIGRGSADRPLQLAADAPVGIAQLVCVPGADATEHDDDVSCAASVIVAPPAAYQLENVTAERVWVLAVQLYSVRSRRNWGMGDFTDLLALVRLSAEVGAAGIGLNPMHALYDNWPEQASPYSPNSRLFLNTLYIDVETLPDFPGLAGLGIEEAVTRARAADQVDYAGVGEAKVMALEACYAAFTKTADPARRADFEAFRAERGRALRRFAAFEVLRRRFQRVWWDWPDPWRDPGDDEIDRLRAESPDEVGYFEYVQWIADRQLSACRKEAQRLGLPIGLYIDLAVGVEPGGADAWGQQRSMVPQVEIGAPPDLLNTAGQAWGLAAFKPSVLAADAFAPFYDLLEAAMRHAGAIRLDHVLGLNRLYLIPFGLKPHEGAYVRYPLQALLAVVALQSVAHRCLVIGEDLGTVPDDLRAILADWGIWSYLVMLFERDPDGAFKAPDDLRRNALVTFSTHDLPTFSGWRSGHDLAVKRSLELDPGETDAERKQARAAMQKALAGAGLPKKREPAFLDVARYLARARSRLMVVEIEDVLGLEDQPNIPGTVTEHPNWRRRLPVDLEDLAAHPQLRAVSAALLEEGRGWGTPRPPDVKPKARARARRT